MHWLTRKAYGSDQEGQIWNRSLHATKSALSSATLSSALWKMLNLVKTRKAVQQPLRKKTWPKAILQQAISPAQAGSSLLEFMLPEDRDQAVHRVPRVWYSMSSPEWDASELRKDRMNERFPEGFILMSNTGF